MTTIKIVRYAAAFLLCAVGVFVVGTVLSGHFHACFECFAVESLGLVLFYYGQKLGWLTYDPDVETLGDRRREAGGGNSTEVRRTGTGRRTVKMINMELFCIE